MKVNRKLFVIVLCVFAIAMVAQIGMASEEKAAADTELTIQGTIEQSDAGLVIVADDGEYQLSGQDLSAMVGKQVKVTGTLTEGEGVRMIKVMSVEELK